MILCNEDLKSQSFVSAFNIAVRIPKYVVGVPNVVVEVISTHTQKRRKEGRKERRRKGKGKVIRKTKKKK